ncbi:MAG: S8 family serine peptidase [Acidobacteriota bacterium]|nr:S8 family serine peptidase [Acidobacteriota bacterium]
MTAGAVRVAIIDSGVHASHPHVNGVAGGVGIDSEGHEHDDYVDRLGHGTAVAAVIREKAPDAQILAVKVFDRELAATGVALVAACEWALREGAHLVNLSLGTLNTDHEPALADVVRKLRAAGAIVIAAGPENGAPAFAAEGRYGEVSPKLAGIRASGGGRWLPGSLPGVWSVSLDWSIPREEAHVIFGADGSVTFQASGFPRPIPGVPPDKNLKGLSFAVANATGVLAGLLALESGNESPAERLMRAVGSRN